jgi:hypothetical protein
LEVLEGGQQPRECPYCNVGKWHVFLVVALQLQYSLGTMSSER